MILRIHTIFAVILCLILAIQLAECADRYYVRKGGRLERYRDQTLSEWRGVLARHKNHHHRHRRHRRKRKRHDADASSIRIDHVMAQMDSMVRPRFGRSIPFMS
ncbi:hypothetical protein WR25_02805 [Diploscapter pachys]|uniref:Uncharacterized protein n=1 Tax=Diploscapter pachys TaxID=2018661 RepID=A0A2A2LXZ2_9BILA|nr:hypothetical protein WR25_02805 [Diploscapter pachys]